MALDGGLIVGYLTAAAVGAGKRWVDRSVDSLLDRLTAKVAGRVGRGPVDRLEQNPRDEQTQRELGLTIDGAISGDRAFARDIANIVAELDKRGGRKMINQVYAHNNVQAFDHGIAVGGDFNYFHTPDPSDLSGAPLWTKFFIALGAATCISAFGIFGYTLFTDMPELGDPDFGDTPPGIPLAAAVFFIGFILVGIGSMGASMSRRRR